MIAPQYMGYIAADTESEFPLHHLYFLELDSIERWPRELDLRSEHFCLFLATDAGGHSDEELLGLASTALRQGAAYLVAWGKDCERVHDMFDVAARPYNASLDEDHVIMTTWHPDEPLDDALYFFVFDASPTEDYGQKSESWVACSIGSRDFAEHIRRRLSDPQSLRDDVLDAFVRSLPPEEQIELLDEERDIVEFRPSDQPERFP